MSTSTTKKTPEQEEIERIAARMILKAKNVAIHWGKVADARKKIAELPTGTIVDRAAKLAEFDGRLAQLDRAATDYEKASKMILAFPALFEAALRVAIPNKTSIADGAAIRTAGEAYRWPKA